MLSNKALITLRPTAIDLKEVYVYRVNEQIKKKMANKNPANSPICKTTIKNTK